ncbi:MAG: protein kinase [Nitrospirae bacterium YQR-1]
MATKKELSTISGKESGLWSKNDVIDNRYEVRNLARGGMGEVYFVYDREIGRMMAVKTPLPSVLSNEEGLKRFYREAEAWISLGIHPNICSAYYVQVMEGIPRLFVEYVDAGAMDKWLKEGRFSTLTEKLDIAIQIAYGMDHTHSLKWTDEDGAAQTGLVHRDLKPANILMSRYGTALITDFGLVGLGSWGSDEILTISEKNKSMIDLVSSQLQSGEDSLNPWQTMTIGGVPFGTPQYMAPEQFENAHTAGIPADIYAYGCILYELFCGRRPFLLTDEERQAVIFYQLMLWQKKHTKEPPPIPLELTAKIDDELSSLMQECLAKTTNGRPDSFKEISSRLISIYSRLTGTPYPRPEAKSDTLKADSLNNQGVSYATINQLHRAENSWNDAISIEPEHVEATFNLTLLKCKTGRLTGDAAVSEMSNYLQSIHHPGQGKFLMGKLHLFHGDEYNALNLINEVLSVGKESVEALKLQALSIATREVTRHDTISLKKAADSFKWFLDNGKEDPVVATGFCHCLRELGEDYSAFYDTMRERFKELPDSLDDAVYRYLPGFSVQRTYFDEFREPTAIAVTKDGKAICAGMSDGHINIYDIKSASPIAVFKKNTAKITAIDINIKKDRIAAGYENGSINILNAGDGEVIHTFSGHTKTITAVRFLASTVYVISASTDGMILMWDMKNAKGAGAFKTEKKPVTALALSHDLKHVYTTHKGGPPCVWETKSGKLKNTFSGHSGGGSSIALSGNGQLAVTSGDREAVVILWDTETGKSIHTFSGHTGKVLYVGMSADGRFMLSADERNLRVWDMKSKLTYSIFKYRGPFKCAALGVGESKLAIAHNNEIMVVNYQNTYNLSYTLVTPATIREEEIRYEFSKRLTDAAAAINRSEFDAALNLTEGARSLTGYEYNAAAIELLTSIPIIYTRTLLRDGLKIRDFSQFKDSLNALAITSDGKYLIAGGNGGTVDSIEISTGKMTNITESTGRESIRTLAVDYTSGLVCFNSGKNNVRTWDIGNNKLQSDITVHCGPVNALALTSDGHYAFSASSERTIRLLDTLNGRYLGRFEESADEITTLALLKDEMTLISGTVNGLLIFWDSVTGKVKGSTEGHRGAINSISFSADGQYVLSGGDDGFVCIFSVKTMSRVKRHKISATEVLGAVFHPGGKYFTACTHDDTIYIYSVESGQPVVTLSGHKDGVNSLVFSRNGWYLYSAGRDATVIKWFLDWETAEGPDIYSNQTFNQMTTEYLHFAAQKREPSRAEAAEDAVGIAVLTAGIKSAGLEFLIDDTFSEKLKQTKAAYGKSAIMRPSLIQAEIAQKPAELEIKTRMEKKKLSMMTMALALFVAVLASAYFIYQNTVTRYSATEINKKEQEDNYFPIVTEALKSLERQTSGCKPAEIDSYRESYMVFIKKNRASVQASHPKSLENISCLISYRTDASVVKTLISEMIRTTDTADSQALGYLLTYMGNNALPALSAMLRDDGFVSGNKGGAKQIVFILSAIATNEAVNELLTLISEKPELTGITSPFLGKIFATGKIASPDALSVVESLLSNTDYKVRKDAVSALRYFKGSKAKELVAKGLSDLNSEVAGEAQKISEKF